jgi:hypothetical protein
MVLAVWAVVQVIRNRPPGRFLFAGSLLLEVLLLAYLVVGIVAVLTADREVAGVELLIYLLAMVALLPLAIWWTSGESGRAAAGVLAVVFLLMPVLVVRVQQVWAGVSG